MSLDHRTVLIWIFLTILSLETPTLMGQAGEWTGKSIFDRMEAMELPTVTLITDLHELQTNKKLTEYIPATFLLINDLGEEERYEIKVRPRGRFRRSKCDFPPLKLNFDKDELEAAGYLEYDNFKLVNSCLEDRGEPLVLREYLVYKLYELLTNDAYRSTMVSMTFQDINGKVKSFNWYGIILESTNQLETRLASEEYEGFNLPITEVDRMQYQIMATFEYMVGNTDWGLNTLKNMKLFDPYDGGKYIPIPYDFDFCGIVGAPYASPRPELPIRTVKDRIFLGESPSPEEAREMMNLFRNKKVAFLNAIDSFELLRKSSRNDMKKYIEAFYDHMENQPADFFDVILPFQFR